MALKQLKNNKWIQWHSTADGALKGPRSS